jgi:hypothetical protein
MELITTALLAYAIAKFLDSKESGSTAQPAAGKKPSELAAKWRSAPVKDSASLNKAAAFTADKAAAVTRHTLVYGKTLSKSWKSAWGEAWRVLWEADDRDDPEPDDPEPEGPKPEGPKPKPKAAEELDLDELEPDDDDPEKPPTQEKPDPKPPPSSFPYDPRGARPLRIVKDSPPAAVTPPTPPAAPTGRTSTMTMEVTGYQGLLTFLLEMSVNGINDMEIAQVDAKTAMDSAAGVDQIAAQIGSPAYGVDEQSVAEVRALVEAETAFAAAQKAAAAAAERRATLAKATHEQVKQRYALLVEGAAVAPAVPTAAFLLDQ